MSGNRLYTASWRRALDYDGDDIVVVRTSIGKPRWISKAMADAIPFVKELAPWGLLGKDIPWDDFARRYRKRLDDVGTSVLDERFSALQRRHDGLPLVLVCFEGNPMECHRSVFAEWWLEQTGEVIPELGGSCTHLRPGPPKHTREHHVQESLI